MEASSSGVPVEHASVERSGVPVPPSRRVRVLQRLAGWAAVVMVVCIALPVGLYVRAMTFELTTPIHFFGDINRGMGWGLSGSGAEGYLNQYEKMSIQEANWQLWLDYGPLRLAVKTMWGHWVREHYPDHVAARSDLFRAWKTERHFSTPVLWFNTGMEILGAVCAFLLTRHWVRRCDIVPVRRPSVLRNATQRVRAWIASRRTGEHVDRTRFVDDNAGLITPAPPVAPWYTLRGVGAGLVAGLIIWFNPAMHLSAHGWPTWDMWVVPMYLLALLLASWNCWFLCGLTIALGAMLKGQQFAVAPLFVIWPLLQGRFGAVARWVSGLTFGMAAVASGWLLTYIPPEAMETARVAQRAARRMWEAPYGTFAIQRVVDYGAIAWVSCVTLVMTLGPCAMAVVRRMTRREQLAHGDRAFGIFLFASIAVTLGVAAVLLWPMRTGDNAAWLWKAVPVALGVGIVVSQTRLRHAFYLGAFGCGAALLLCMALFNGSNAWWLCAFKFGTIHWQWMIMGATSNLPGLLHLRFDWDRDALQTVFTIPVGVIWNWPGEAIVVTAKQAGKAIFAVLLTLCAIGVSRADARNDRRILIAFVAPWVMFFTFPCQIHERYLLFAAGAAAILVGHSVGMALLGLFLTGVTWIMTMNVMLNNDRPQREFGIYLNTLYPEWFNTDFGFKLHRFISGTHPDIAWAVLLCAGIFLYYAIVPSRRSNQMLPLERSNPL